MGFAETDLDADGVVSHAARLVVSAEQLAEQISGPLAEIRAINAAAPWGQDAPGQAFARSYSGADQDGVDSLLEGAGALSDHAASVGETTGIGAIETQQADEDARAELERQVSEAEVAHQRLLDLSAGGGLPAVRSDQAASQQAWDLRWAIQDPAVAERLGAGQVAEIAEFLDDIQAAGG